MISFEILILLRTVSLENNFNFDILCNIISSIRHKHFFVFRRTFIKKCSQGLKWILDDVKNPNLIWVKVIFFLQSASLVSLYPYVSLHMRSIGFNMEDASIVNSVIPVVDIVGPPFAGILADTLGNFRIFMAIVTLLNGISALLLLTVQPVDFTPNPINTRCCYNSTLVLG